MKRAVLTDSTANIGEELYNHPDVFQADLVVEFSDGETYADTWDEEKIKSFYEKMRNSESLPTTSQPSPHQFSQAYQSIIDQGYDSVIVITVAKGVSGTFQNAHITAEEYSGQIEIFPFSSGSGAYGARNMVEHILKWYQQDLSNEEILEKLEILQDETRVYGAIHDLTNIRKGGRVSHLGGSVAGALKVAAVFNVKHDELGLEKVTLGKKRVRRKIFNQAEQEDTGIYVLSRNTVVGTMLTHKQFDEIVKRIDQLEEQILDYEVVLRLKNENFERFTDEEVRSEIASKDTHINMNDGRE